LWKWPIYKIERLHRLQNTFNRHSSPSCSHPQVILCGLGRTRIIKADTVSEAKEIASRMARSWQVSAFALSFHTYDISPFETRAGFYYQYNQPLDRYTKVKKDKVLIPVESPRILP
jgi:hypothetical protein